MADKKKGYVPIWRDIQDHWIWTSDEPFDSRSAWVDLILLANHDESKIKIGMRVITIHAGEKWTSISRLADRWNWSYKKVKRFLSMLEDDDMVKVKTSNEGTLITLVNYEVFALSGRADDRTDDRTNDIADDRTDDQQTIMYKNNKRMNKNEKEKAAPLRDLGGYIIED